MSVLGGTVTVFWVLASFLITSIRTKALPWSGSSQQPYHRASSFHAKQVSSLLTYVSSFVCSQAWFWSILWCAPVAVLKLGSLALSTPGEVLSCLHQLVFLCIDCLVGFWRLFCGVFWCVINWDGIALLVVSKGDGLLVFSFCWKFYCFGLDWVC